MGIGRKDRKAVTRETCGDELTIVYFLYINIPDILEVEDADDHEAESSRHVVETERLGSSSPPEGGNSICFLVRAVFGFAPDQ